VPFAPPPASVAEFKPNPARLASPVTKPALTHCPYCSCKLSSVEVKMERCLSCGAQFSPASGASSHAQDAESFIVRF
jgi:hypothetical protein